MSETVKRHNGSLILEHEPNLPFSDARCFEEGATITKQGNYIRISIAEEKAVDSYNSSFTCSITMDKEMATALRDFIDAALNEKA